MNDKIITILLKLAKKAYKKGEIPVSAVIVENNKIISKAYNKREKRNNPLLHAEIIAISKASQKKKSWKLNDCDLYVTLEPCAMCKKIINEARIKKVYFILDSKYNNDEQVTYKKINTNVEYYNLFKKFFKEIRNR